MTSRIDYDITSLSMHSFDNIDIQCSLTSIVTS